MYIPLYPLKSTNIPFIKALLEILLHSYYFLGSHRHPRCQEQKSEDSERKVLASGLLVAHKSLADIAYTGVPGDAAGV